MKKIIEEAAGFVKELFDKELDSRYRFHSLDHVLETVEAAGEIARHSGLDETQREILLIAAWFHDAGYVEQYDGHEEKSAEIAGKFLEAHQYPAERIKEVERLIMATKMGHEPADLPEEIIKDADMIHLGKKSSFKKGEMLRRELDELRDHRYSDTEWLELEEKFYDNARFHTQYARKEYGERLEKNLKKIRARLQNMNPGNENENGKSGLSASEKSKVKKASKIKLPQRGVETVFRTTSRNHLRLSAIADNKANTLISISALIISIILTFLIDTLEVNPGMFPPTILLLATCVTTIIFATLSTKPKVTENTVTREDIKSRRGNLLFFGNFYRMQLEDYQWGMTEMMHDSDYLYGNLMQDIYYLGLVLARKYKYLRIAYSVFMYGIIASVLAFLLTMYVFAAN